MYIVMHLLSEEQFKLILTGTVHPLTIAEKLHHIPWVDDFTDKLLITL